MINQNKKNKRSIRVRSKLARNKGLPRLTIFRSNIHIWAQVIDDKHGLTLVSSSSKELKTKGTKIVQATAVGADIAKKCLKANIKRIRFDRGPYLYHGRIKSLADSARLQGLKF
jgi:large subunit ribosomal protein L18